MNVLVVFTSTLFCNAIRGPRGYADPPWSFAHSNESLFTICGRRKMKPSKFGYCMAHTFITRTCDFGTLCKDQ